MMRNGDLRRGGPDYPEKTCGDSTLLTLAGVADAIASVPDYRKMILFIGTEAPSPDGPVTGDPLECGLTISLHEQLLRALDRGSVTVHAFDPRGLTTGVLGAEAFPGEKGESAMTRIVREGQLRRLPDYTGGRTIVNVNQPEDFVSAVFEESRTYYVLAVERGPAHRNGQSHKVQIEVDRRDASVVSRTTYLDAATAASKKSSSDPLQRALGELLPRNEVSLRMTLAPGETKDGSLDVTLATPLAAPARADVLVGLFDEFGKPVGSERAKVDLPAGAGGDVDWKMHLNPKPGHSEVRAAVRIGTVIGSITGYVDVPATTASRDKANDRAIAAPHVRAEPSAAAAALLARSAAYLEQYSDPTNGLVLEERYTQRVNARPPRVRQLRSDLLILPDAAEGWLQYRDVMDVDGRPVADRTDRLMRLFSSPAADAREQARRIVNEGARYNISGAVTLSRTLNQPLAALLFLRGAAQPRSEFRLEGNGGRGGQHVSFVEIMTPSLIGVTGGQPAKGEFWIDPSSGRILRSELHVMAQPNTGTVLAIIAVTYAYDAKTKLMLPTLMKEDYAIQDRRGSPETIEGAATYSNPRQFKVTTDSKTLPPPLSGVPHHLP